VLPDLLFWRFCDIGRNAKENPPGGPAVKARLKTMPPTARTPLARPQRPQRCCPQKFTRCVLITAVFTAISLLLAWEVKSGGAWARPSTWRDYTSSHHNARLRSLETWRANATAEIAALKRRDAELSDRIKALEGGGGGGASSSKSLEERLAKDEAQEQADVKTLRKETDAAQAKSQAYTDHRVEESDAKTKERVDGVEAALGPHGCVEAPSPVPRVVYRTPNHETTQARTRRRPASQWIGNATSSTTGSPARSLYYAA